MAKKMEKGLGSDKILFRKMQKEQIAQTEIYLEIN